MVRVSMRLSTRFTVTDTIVNATGTRLRQVHRRQVTQCEPSVTRADPTRRGEAPRLSRWCPQRLSVRVRAAGGRSQSKSISPQVAGILTKSMRDRRRLCRESRSCDGGVARRG